MARPNKAHEKAKDFKSACKRLALFCKSYWGVFIACILLTIFTSILSVVGPNILRTITDEIITNMHKGINMQVIVRLCVTLVVIYAVSALIDIIHELVLATTTRKISKDLRKSMNKKINQLPLGYIDSNSYGNVMSCAINDVDTISQGLDNALITFFSASSLLLASLVMMFITNWIMAFTAIGSCLIGFIAISVIMKKSQKHFVAQQQKLGEVNGHIEEIFTAHDVVNVYNAKGIKREKFIAHNNGLFDSSWKAQFYGGLMPNLMSFIGSFGYVAICVVGAVLVTKGVITTGVIVAFMLYVRLFSNPLTQIANSMAELQSTAAASERVFEILDEKEIKEQKNLKPFKVEKVKGNVEFTNVNFSYVSERKIIDDFSVSIKQGQKVAIVGPTGSGKTTIVNLLMRFYEIDSGKITIDGTDIKKIHRNDLHNAFGMVLQDTWLFEGTLRDNLVYNQEGITDEQLDKVCEICGLTHFVETLPDRYDTILNDNTKISLGQKQLITIARAMLQNAPMLILDEATSSIDTRTEALVQKALDKLTENRTSFVIAHRLSTIRNADIILVLKDGKLIESGNHKQLMAKKGFYADLYNSQFAR